ncbi:MAG: hypothetical protein NXH91_14840 [Phyllobacteriaceae bacterium]|jgi:hypothetical protein|nr:hypothetical protein [Phyllobacteriaceae bacterium]
MSIPKSQLPELPLDRLSEFQSKLPECWSLSSSTLWTKDNPAAGHCGVTALVVHDLFGGEIAKTPFRDIWHFYNIIEGARYDFTDSQFEAPPGYEDVISDRDEAFVDTNAQQYEHLSKAVGRAMKLR